MPNLVRLFNLDNKGNTMTTLQVLERARTTSIAEVIEAIENFGADNVTLKFASDVLYTSNKTGFSDYESYIKLASVANKETLQTVFDVLISYQEYAQVLSQRIGVSLEDFYERLLTMGAEKDVFFDNIPMTTSLSTLNVLAEKKLVRMYYVERTKSIDLDFVRKYESELDMGNLYHCSENTEVLNYIDSLQEREED